MSSRVAAAVGLAFVSCGQLPALLTAAPDGGQTRVPGSYLDARISPGHRTHLALSGEKQLGCRDCHFIADAGFSGSAVRPCADCHQKQQEHHHPFDGGVAMTCLSCHVFRSIGEQAKIDRWGCERCHAPKLEVHRDRCQSCHRPHGTPFTRAADCGQCHDVTVKHGKGEKDAVADTCMSCHPHHTAAPAAVGRCSACHPANQQGLFAKGHTGCSTCHASHQFTAASAAACRNCHRDQPVLALDKHGGCITCHDAHAERAAPKTCESCHLKTHVTHPPDTAGRPCLGCHPVHDAAVATSDVQAAPCASCHSGAPFAGPSVHAAGVACAACHKAPHAGKPPRAGLCESCHKEQHALVKGNAGHAKCEGCHAGLPHAPPAPPKPCLDCHQKSAPPQQGHTRCESCHQTHSAKVVKRCTDCHAAPLPGLHVEAKHRACESCHRAHAPEPGFGPASCTACHATPSKKNHPTPPQQCVSCHLFGARR